MSLQRPKSSTPDDTILVIFCRRPRTGSGKRRIARELGDNTTLELTELLLATTLEDATQWPGPIAISPENPEDAQWAESLLQRPTIVVPQTGGNLGKRLNEVDREVRRAGHEKLIFIGSDAPVLHEIFFSDARQALVTADIVLGPARDGGVTLMGSRQPWPDLSSLPWSSAELGTALEQLCQARGMTQNTAIYRLEELYDIDLTSDLLRLHGDLAADSRPARQLLRQWIETQNIVQT